MDTFLPFMLIGVGLGAPLGWGLYDVTMLKDRSAWVLVACGLAGFVGLTILAFSQACGG